MAGPEKTVENQIKAFLDKTDAWYFKVAASPLMPPGIPDIIACIFGKFIGIEVKAPGKINNTSLVQKVQHKLIRKAGGQVWVVDSYEMFLRNMHKLKVEVEDGRTEQ